jgi:M6 family metalloprotease-like protein
MVVMDEALAYLSTKMDLSEFDSDNNGTIDSVVIINTLDVGNDDFHWANRYWNFYVDENNDRYKHDGVSVNDYVWASYYFMQEEEDETGYLYYDDASITNPFTLIHEFGHILGAEDYYDTSGAENHPLNNADVMDDVPGDHNPYSKFNYGWVTTSRLVTTTDSITLTLESFTETGDSIIIANNWDEELGAYQEYYIISYYTISGLNSGDGGYFNREGIVVYHVNASLYLDEVNGKQGYSVFNTNTDPSDEFGTVYNLIEFVYTDYGAYTFIEGDTLPTVTDDNGDLLIYSFTVNSIDEDCATITITRN